MSWNCDEEKLLCHIVLVDSMAKKLSERAGPAFFRGFIVEDRATGIISMKYRYRYEDGERNWFSVTPKQQQGPGTAKELEKSMLAGLREAARRLCIPLPPGSVVFFYPPDDGGEFERTLEWLQERDLIEIAAVAPRGAES